MFYHPRIQPGAIYPDFPNAKAIESICQALDVPIDIWSPEGAFMQLTRHAIGWVERNPKYVRPEYNVLVKNSHLAPALKTLGLLDPIPPTDQFFDYVLVDGGNTERYRTRLQYLDQALSQGNIVTERVVVFAGQARRDPKQDNMLQLRATATTLLPHIDEWGRAWIEQELRRSDVNPSLWARPFSTERELAFLHLYERYGKNLYHTKQLPRSTPKSIDPSIPPALVAADEFEQNGRRILTLNAPAIIREHASRKMPLEYARPTGRSCYHEWLILDKPPLNSSVLLISHAPNIYRSWLDILIRNNLDGRHDLRITAAGAGIGDTMTVLDILTGLGDLIINFYNIRYEQAISAHPTHQTQNNRGHGNHKARSFNRGELNTRIH